MTTHPPQVPYKETIRKSVSSIHGRYKRKAAVMDGWGCLPEIKPLPRGELTSGYNCWRRSAEAVYSWRRNGRAKFLAHGPLGFPLLM